MLRKDEAGKLSYELLGELAEGAAKRVLPAEIRLSIRQVALERPPRKPPPKATTQPPTEARRRPRGTGVAPLKYPATFPCSGPATYAGFLVRGPLVFCSV